MPDFVTPWSYLLGLAIWVGGSLTLLGAYMVLVAVGHFIAQKIRQRRARKTIRRRLDEHYF
jgi:hypothetical protein